MRFWGAVLGIGIMWYGAIVIAQAWGARIQPFPHYLGDCELPCWSDVHIGNDTDTKFWQTYNALPDTANHYRTIDVSTRNAPVVDEIEFQFLPSSRLRFGDVLLLYGAPTAIRVSRVGTLTQAVGARQLVTEISAFWANGYVKMIATQSNLSVAQSISPDMVVRVIHMRDVQQTEDLMPVGTRQWRGFGNALRYENSSR